MSAASAPGAIEGGAIQAGAIRVRGLTWTPLGRRRPTVEGLDLRIEPGERVLLLGASGAGKSTVLHALTGALGGAIAGDLVGRVEVGGRLGLVPQDPADAIVAERIGRDVAFGPENLGLDRAEIWARVDDALDSVGLRQGRAHPTSALSGGERQRLVLAGVLAMRPDVLLLDEPTSMLDAVTAADVRDAFLRVADGRTLVVVEHRFEPWLASVDRVVVLDGGRIAFDGSPGTFRETDQPALWMPGRPDPVPLDLDPALVAPAGPVLEPVATDLRIELVSRALRGSTRTVAVDDLDLTLAAGRRLALVGPSGAGKSTALAALGGLIRPTSGQVTPELRRWSSRDLAAVLGWVPQDPETTFVTSRVRDEVATTAHRVGRTVDVDAVLDVLRLGPLADAHPLRLSGGEQRRLALAATLAHRPGLVLLDEPTVGQDRGTWAAVAGWVAAAAAQGATVALSTHDRDLPVDDVVTMRAGRAA